MKQEHVNTFAHLYSIANRNFFPRLRLILGPYDQPLANCLGIGNLLVIMSFLRRSVSEAHRDTRNSASVTRLRQDGCWTMK